jgi:hypothetical protein
MADAVELRVWNGTAWAPLAGVGGSSEPQVFVSDVAPAPPGVDAIWIDPTGDSTGTGTGTSEFTASSPITVVEDPIIEQADGTPIGLSADGQTFHQPLITGAIPVVIGGKKYLIPICDV